MSSPEQVERMSEVALPPLANNTRKTDPNIEQRAIQSVIATLSNGAQITFLHLEHTEGMSFMFSLSGFTIYKFLRYLCIVFGRCAFSILPQKVCKLFGKRWNKVEQTTMC